MSDISEKIHRSHLLTGIFGRWPSFHDAEVISIELSRNLTGIAHPTLKARIYAFEVTSEVDDRGYYVNKNHVLAAFIFRDIDELSMSGFNQQNVLSHLAIVDISSKQLERLRFEIRFSSLFGVEAEFKCHSIEIETVDPYAPEANENLPRQSDARPGEFKHN